MQITLPVKIEIQVEDAEMYWSTKVCSLIHNLVFDAHILLGCMYAQAICTRLFSHPLQKKAWVQGCMIRTYSCHYLA